LSLQKNPVKVYNFQVEDYHTYYVGENGVWVHNAQCKPRSPKSDLVDKVENADGSITYTKNINGTDVNVSKWELVPYPFLPAV
jgi:hypothetical protein